MKNIAIFVSGEGEATERIVKLFNEGNRLKTVFVVLDDSSESLQEKIKDKVSTILHIPDAQWHERSLEVAQILKDLDVKLIVLDNFALVLSDEIMEATEGEIIRISSPEMAPKEVVEKLEADLRRPVEEVKIEETETGDSSLESEWANALKIRYTPPKIPTTPPGIPENEIRENMKEENPESGNVEEPLDQNKPWEKNYYYTQTPGSAPRSSHHNHNEPMPSTWLIWSVLVTVFCCFIPGIVAIIFSSQVSSKYYAGDYEGAKRASRTAEIWIIVSFVLGVLSATLYLPFMLIG